VRSRAADVAGIERELELDAVLTAVGEAPPPEDVERAHSAFIARTIELTERDGYHLAPVSDSVIDALTSTKRRVLRKFLVRMEHASHAAAAHAAGVPPPQFTCQCQEEPWTPAREVIVRHILDKHGDREAELAADEETVWRAAEVDPATGFGDDDGIYHEVSVLGGGGGTTGSVLRDELHRLHAELQRVRAERDFLRREHPDAATIYAAHATMKAELAALRALPVAPKKRASPKKKDDPVTSPRPKKKKATVVAAVVAPPPPVETETEDDDEELPPVRPKRTLASAAAPAPNENEPGWWEAGHPKKQRLGAAMRTMSLY
jgi:hypothetical protein